MNTDLFYYIIITNEPEMFVLECKHTQLARFFLTQFIGVKEESIRISDTLPIGEDFFAKAEHYNIPSNKVLFFNHQLLKQGIQAIL